MAYAALGKDTARADYTSLAERFTSDTKNLNSFEREALDHVAHASDALVVPIYSLIPLTDFQIERLIGEVKDPDYVEGSGMKFKVVKWKGKKGLSERDLEVEMLKVAVRKRKGLLVFADEGSVAGEGVRISNYVSGIHSFPWRGCRVLVRCT